MDDSLLQAMGLAAGLIFTLMIYSYLLGDNPLYRLAVHILVGVGLGYAAVVAIYAVIIPQLIIPFQETVAGNVTGIENQVQPLAALLAMFLLLKLSPRTAPLGNLAMAFVIGVGSAVAVGGALLGTLLPQINATAVSIVPDAASTILPGQSGLFNTLAALVLLSGTITSLLYFHFGARPAGGDQVERPAWARVAAQIGQVFLMIAFGSLYAGTLIASLSILTERAQFLIDAPLEILRLLNLG